MYAATFNNSYTRGGTESVIDSQDFWLELQNAIEQKTVGFLTENNSFRYTFHSTGL